jgi:hypothetical protein
MFPVRSSKAWPPHPNFLARRTLRGPPEPADPKAFANVIKLSPVVPLFVAIMSLLLLLLSRCSAAVILLLLPLFLVP